MAVRDKAKASETCEKVSFKPASHSSYMPNVQNKITSKPPSLFLFAVKSTYICGYAYRFKIKLK